MTKEMEKKGREKISGKKESETEKSKPKKEEINEIFEVEKDGKEKIIETHKTEKTEDEKPVPKKQLKNENKIVIIILSLMAGFVILFAGFLLVNYSIDNFKVEGVKFSVDRETLAGKTIYRTSISGVLTSDGKFIAGGREGGKISYNIYFRSDPRKIINIPMNERMEQVNKFNVINSTEFKCEGYEIIAVANIINLYEALGGIVVKDENASCDQEGKYGWIDIHQADNSSIERFGPACYNLYVADCEILEVTERFMLETLIRFNKEIGM